MKMRWLVDPLILKMHPVDKDNIEIYIPAPGKKKERWLVGVVFSDTIDGALSIKIKEKLSAGEEVEVWLSFEPVYNTFERRINFKNVKTK